MALHQEVIRSQGQLDTVDAELFKVLNMLNAKWVIMPAQDGTTLPIENPHAMGNAWFVDDIRFVESADEEIDVLRTLDLSKEAVADKQYESLLAGQVPTPTDSASTIVLTDYDSDFVTYAVDAKKDELALFSEVYYPKGWQVSIDGEPVEMLRANYTLRALPIPAGKHTVEFRFEPRSIRVTDGIAYTALAIILLTLIALIVRTVHGARTTRSSSDSPSA